MVLVALTLVLSLAMLPEAAESVRPGAEPRAASSAAAALTFHQEVWAEFLDGPTAMEFAPDGRLFVAQQAGNVRIVRDGMLLQEPFLTVDAAVHPEGGLIGVTLDPAFETSGFVYVYYTYALSEESKANRVSRFQVSESDPDRADLDSEAVIIDGIPGANVHNGGGLHFGVDGMLYIGTGAVGTDDASAQDLGTLAGKLLRLNPDGTVPDDNPFVGQDGVRPEIYAYGLRNAFSFGIDPQTGLMLINDVGDDAFEEVNVGSPGANYGWPLCEGYCGTNASGVAVSDELVDPLYVYPHGVGSAIAGGKFVRSPELPEALQGSYVFADFLQDFIRVLDPRTGRACDLHVGDDEVRKPVDLDIGPDGHLYYLRNVPGKVYRLSIAGNPAGVASERLYLLGDLNCSGETDSIDALLVLHTEAGYISFLLCQCADVNNDLRVDSVDASLILQHDARLIDISDR